jgi:hypothetical protein
MTVLDQSIRRVQYFFNKIFYAFMEIKVEVNSRSANCELTQVAYLMIPTQIFKTINAGLHSDYSSFRVGRTKIQSTNTEQKFHI